MIKTCNQTWYEKLVKKNTNEMIMTFIAVGTESMKNFVFHNLIKM